MQSFSYKAKAELCRVPLTRRCCARAEAYGVLLYAGSFSPTEVRIVTESEDFAARLPKLFQKAFSVRFDAQESGSKSIFRITDGQKLAVILEALGYDPDGSSDMYKKYWPADVHIIGKDIVRFHTIYWPIFLMSLGLPLPKQVFGHPWLLQDGGKMSKSKGNVIYADDLVGFFGVDAVRYFLLAEMPYETDGIINWEWITDKINNDLANIYGNLVSRTVAMSNKYFGGVLENAGAKEDVDDDLIATVTGAYEKVRAKINEFKISDALSEIFVIFKRANKYIDETMPWALAKDESKTARLKTVLYNLAESIVIGTSLLEPFMPDTAAKVTSYFGTTVRDYGRIVRFGGIENGTKVVENPEILFRRLDVKEVVDKAHEMYEARKKPAAPEVKEEEKPEIDIDYFAGLDLRVAKVVACEKVPKAEIPQPHQRQSETLQSQKSFYHFSQIA